MTRDLLSARVNPGAGLAQLALKPTAIDKFLYLSTIRKNNVHLFYRLVSDHLRVSWPCRILTEKPLTAPQELTPLIYTPVVGEACQRWSEIYQQPEGKLMPRVKPAALTPARHVSKLGR